MSDRKVPTKKELAASLHKKGIETTPDEVEQAIKEFTDDFLERLRKRGIGIDLRGIELSYETRVRIIMANEELPDYESKKMSEMIKQWQNIAKTHQFIGFHLVRHPVEREWEPRFFKNSREKNLRATQARRAGYHISATYYAEETSS